MGKENIRALLLTVGANAWFAAPIDSKRKYNVQLDVSENKDVIFFQSKFIDPMEITGGFD